MLNKFAAALVATTLIAAPAFAQNAKPAGAMPATQAVPAAANAVQTTNPASTATTKTAATKTSSTKSVKHARKHVARGKSGAIHQAHHVKPAKTHQAGIAKSSKPIDGGRSRA